MRLVLGPWWGIGIAAFNVVSTTSLLAGDDPLIETKVVGIYVVSAIAVEIVARIVGTEQPRTLRRRSGLGVATLGFAGDYWWNSDHAYQPWNTNLLPDAVVFGVIVGVAAALLATAFARAAGHQNEAAPIPRPVLAVAGLTVLVCLALPMPRTTGDVTGDVSLTDRAGGFAQRRRHAHSAPTQPRKPASSRRAPGPAAASNSPNMARSARGATSASSASPYRAHGSRCCDCTAAAR